MKVKRFVAQDMRQAIRMVRETLGEDAVILSNKSVDGGVELMAAVDFEPSTAGDTIDRRIEPKSVVPVRQAVGVDADTTDPIVAIRQEMQALRRLMETELGELSWRDLGDRRPASREILRRLLALGLAPELACDLVAQTGDLTDVEQAWRKALYYLASRIAVQENELLDSGGVIALVGPTGVGKTTTIAKLAARFALRHGNRHVGLISIDNYRIGARDQLHTYGRILNVPVRIAGDVQELDVALDALSDRHLVLIDTAGMAIANDQFDEQVAMLSESRHDMTRLLTLSATTEMHALERAAQLFAQMAPDACLLTKLDEAASLGAALSVVARTSIPVAFVTDGQRVPEDLHIARAHPLVNRAVELQKQEAVEPDQDYMAYAYAEGRTHAAL